MEIQFNPVLRVVLALCNDFLYLFGNGLLMGFRVHKLNTVEIFQIQGNPTENSAEILGCQYSYLHH